MTVGRIYLELVKDFWVHATVTPTAIISFVLGHEVVITEKLIRKLYNLNDEEGWSGLQPGTVNWYQVKNQISLAFGAESHKTGTLRPFYQVWAEIILGSLHHRKQLFSSSSYISPDHKYTLFCIGRRMELNISHILFQNLKTSLVESRDEERAKCPHLPRNIIPFARMISDILIESDLLDSIRTTGASQFLGVVQGHVFNGVDLFRLDLLKEVTSVGTSFPNILSRRVPVTGFTTLFQAEHRKA